ncbi:MAG TPA: flavodoxin-dependent (E)-4-hydroxy-3-methylbut-2-enyl-diphosphate synthase [Candidatus Omnitrophota bacterium]|nr:flavodoxin-dependent (E)-4-hydroxy-3-methylbut-2-enyl-diphosphate synthase [Candidatus Omnitrophota bacterium]HPT38653.1 flavodoxin-dependent (E)-4-hydroxy-3-methylbut-2-enyl-diphosphate synthase [Candidatus Omnitrophota bacterium]
MEIKRRNSRVIKVGDCLIGGKHPVVIQSMTKTKTSDIDKTVGQIQQLETAGCQIVRLAIRDLTDAKALKKIKAKTNLPLVADIHFSYRLAIAAIENGADKIRLNPGNIDKPKEIRAVVDALAASGIPLRIGLNSGSVKDSGHRKSSMTDKLVTACMGYVKIIEKLKFNDIVISLKANNVLDTVEAYRKVAKVCDYPLHLGLTATGAPDQGIIKSSVALGSLLLEGIGDTIRVSLTDNPVEEVIAAKCILESLGLRRGGVQLISCPTCGRCEINLISIVKELENALAAKTYEQLARPLKIAVMGCVVNGPGEAKEADLGVAFGRGAGVLFARGKIVKKVLVKDCVQTLLKEINLIHPEIKKGTRR